MVPVLIITDTLFNDVAAIQSFDLDLAFGDDEQDFVATFAGDTLNGGELVYIDGTEYGGIVDSVESRTDSDLLQYRGRTWHGMLAYKVITPPPGQTHYTVSGDANDCIAAVLTKVGLDGIMSTPGTSSGITVSTYQFARFVDAYTGLRAMLASVGAKLCMSREGGTTVCWAELVDVITDQADSDLVEFDIGKNHRVLNHLVCAGEGEMLDRVVVDLYADADGNVSGTQTFTGVDEIAAYYNYTGADAAELTSEGTKRLKESQSQGSVDIDVHGQGDWRVGDIIEGRDNRTGTVVQAPIVKKLVKVNAQTNYTLEIQYEAGAARGASGGLTNTAEAAGYVYAAGDGITITGNVISADLHEDSDGDLAVTRDFLAGRNVQACSYNLTRDDPPSATTLGAGHRLVDSNGDYIGIIAPQFYANGTEGIRITFRRTVNGTNLYNDLRFQIDSSGNRSIYVTESKPWRTAILDGFDDELITTSKFVTAATNFSITSGGFVRQGKIAQVWLNVKTTNALNAHVNFVPCTLKSGYRPVIRAAATDRRSVGFISDTGDFGMRTTEAIAAGETLYLASTFFLA